MVDFGFIAVSKTKHGMELMNLKRDENDCCTINFKKACAFRSNNLNSNGKRTFYLGVFCRKREIFLFKTPELNSVLFKRQNDTLKKGSFLLR